MLSNEHCQLSDDSFKCLFEAYRKRLYGYVLTITHSGYVAEEITQEIFIRLWINRDVLDKIDNIEGYIFAMARNKTLNYFRKAATDQKLLFDLQARSKAENNNVEEHSLSSEYNRLVQEALALLGPQPRLVYQLSRNKGLNHQEIATTLHLSRNTVKNHLVTALRFIRGYIKNMVASIILSIALLFI